jgi:hypothetical protein
MEQAVAVQAEKEDADSMEEGLEPDDRDHSFKRKRATPTEQRPAKRHHHDGSNDDDHR